jgi:O-antigen/teichoic acid export membrane protein
MIGDSAVGLYNSSTNLIYPITVISSAIIIAIFPSISQNIGRDPDQAIHIYRTSLKYSLLIALPVAMALTFLSDKIYLFLYAQDFYAANVTLKILAWLLPVIFITGIYGYTLAAINKQTIVFLISVTNAFINLGLNVLLIPTYGYNGAAVATVITELIGFLIGSYFLTKYFSRFPFKILLKSLCFSLVILPVLLLKNHLHLIVVVILAAAVYTLLLILFKQISIDSLKEIFRSTAGDKEAGLEHTTIGRNHQT